MRHHYFQLSLFVLYMTGMTALMIYEGIGITPDRYTLVLLLGSLLVRRTRKFLLDFMPFIFILIAYDFLRSFAQNLGPKVNYLAAIDFSKWLFNGHIPTLELQRIFYTPGQLHWYDYLASVFYFLHFALPLAFAFLLWFDSQIRFREFMVSLSLLSYAGWVTYIVFPAAPPWLAALKGYLPPVVKILDLTLATLPQKFNIPTIYQSFDPNTVAAIPSLHAAYPFLILLFLVNYYKLKGLIFLPYCLVVWLSTIYLGEHYVIDIILGAIYASIFFVIGKLLIHRSKVLNYILDKI